MRINGREQDPAPDGRHTDLTVTTSLYSLGQLPSWQHRLQGPRRIETPLVGTAP